MKNWQSILVKQKTPLLSLIQSIKLAVNALQSQIKIKITSTVTDGDFRNKNFSEKNRKLAIKNFMNKNPVFLFKTEIENQEKKIFENSIFF